MNSNQPPAAKISRKYIDSLSQDDLRALLNSYVLNSRPALLRYASQRNIALHVLASLPS